MSMLMSSSTRTCGSSSRAIVSSADAAPGAIGRLLTPGSPRRARGRARAARAAAAAAAARRPARSAGARRPRRRGARSAAGGGGRRAARHRRACGSGSASRPGSPPTMLTDPPAALSASRKASTSASVGSRERAPQLPGLELDDGRRRPSATMPTRDVGRRALGADDLRSPVEGGCRERPPGGEAVVGRFGRACGSLDDRVRDRRRVRRAGCRGIRRQRPCEVERAGRAGRRGRSAGTGRRGGTTPSTSWGPGSRARATRGPRGGPGGTTSPRSSASAAVSTARPSSSTVSGPAGVAVDRHRQVAQATRAAASGSTAATRRRREAVVASLTSASSRRAVRVTCTSSCRARRENGLRREPTRLRRKTKEVSGCRRARRATVGWPSANHRGKVASNSCSRTISAPPRSGSRMSLMRLDDAEVSRRERQRQLVDPLAHLGQEDLARTDDRAADHDHARVEHVDQRGDRLADDAGALLDERDREGIAVLGGAGDVLGREREAFGATVVRGLRSRPPATAASASRTSAQPPATASRQPILPHRHTASDPATRTCPMSPAAPFAPRWMRPCESSPAPMPEPTLQ